MPLVAVTDAALHRGELTIRRSPLVELRTLERSGVTRIDLPGQAVASSAGSVDQSAGHPAVRGVQFRRRAVYGAIGRHAGGGPGVGHRANRA